MPVKEALEATSQYGIATVMAILSSFFLAYMVINNNKRNDKREDRLIELIDKTLHDNELKTNERHEANIKAMAKLEEADKRQREEHDAIIRNQAEKLKELRNISTILENLVLKSK